MTISGTLVHSAAEPTSADGAALWVDRPTDELTAILERGIAGGELFYAANREVQRRAELAEQAAREARAAELRRNRVIALLAILVLLFCLYLVSGLLISG